MIKRAWLYLTRKYKRSALLLLLLFVISCSISIGLCVWRSIGAVTREVQRTLGTSFTVRLPGYVQSPEFSETLEVGHNFLGTWRIYAGPPLDDTVAEEILKIEGVDRCNGDDYAYVHLDDVEPIPGLFEAIIELYYAEKVASTDEELAVDLVFARATLLQGSTDTALYDKFRTGAFTLTEGRHLTPEDTGLVLISDELAERNGLHIGDTITVSSRLGMMMTCLNADDRIGEPMPLEIAGIFHVNGYQPVNKWTSEDEITYNWLIVNAETEKAFQKMVDEAQYTDVIPRFRYDNLTFFVDDPARLEDVVREVKSLDTIETDFYDISADDTMYKSTVDPLNNIRNLIVGAVAVIAAGCAIVLCIIFTMWVRSRRQEIAVYLSMGFSKAAILGQFILEAAIIALVAGALSFAACQQAPGLIGNRMLADSIAEAQPEEREVSREEIHQTIQATGSLGDLFQYESSDYAGPEHIDFTLRASDFAILLLLELLIITAAICRAGWFVFALQPRRILTDFR